MDACSLFSKNNACVVLEEEMEVDDDSYEIIDSLHSNSADVGSRLKTPQGIDIEIVKGSIARQQVR